MNGGHSESWPVSVKGTAEALQRQDISTVGTPQYRRMAKPGSRRVNDVPRLSCPPLARRRLRLPSIPAASDAYLSGCVSEYRPNVGALMVCGGHERSLGVLLPLDKRSDLLLGGFCSAIPWFSEIRNRNKWRCAFQR